MDWGIFEDFLIREGEKIKNTIIIDEKIKSETRKGEIREREYYKKISEYYKYLTSLRSYVLESSFACFASHELKFTMINELSIKIFETKTNIEKKKRDRRRIQEFLAGNYHSR